MLEILLIEDDQVDIMALQRLVKKNSFKTLIHPAANGLEALAILRQPNSLFPAVFEKNLLIMLELNLSRMNGLEFLNELQFNLIFKKVPVIILGSIHLKDRQQIENYDINLLGYLKKPINFLELTQLITIMKSHLGFDEMPQVI